jgi:DNA-binding NarL/FixJ family response regulator
MNGEASYYSTQQAMRAWLLDIRSSISFAPARDLAAHMLLSINDLTQAGNIAAQWLQERLNAERVDGNMGCPADDVYRRGRWESSVPQGVPSTKGSVVDNTDPGMRYVWDSKIPIVVNSVFDEPAISHSARAALLATSTKSKMFMPLRTLDGIPFGLLCVDRVTAVHRTWDTAMVNLFGSVVREVVSPILATAKSLNNDIGLKQSSRPLVTKQLTEAEIKVARLAAQGLGYKEIARELERSVHTVDHQLRSIRTKLGISSHAKLVQFLAR